MSVQQQSWEDHWKERAERAETEAERLKARVAELKNTLRMLLREAPPRGPGQVGYRKARGESLRVLAKECGDG